MQVGAAVLRSGADNDMQIHTDQHRRNLKESALRRDADRRRYNVRGIDNRTTLRLGDRAFSIAAPEARACNRLPSELKTTTCSIETFKRRLKTFFYLILLLVLIRRDNVMRHRSVCRGRTSPCCNCVIVIVN